jgi:hypothetical protein
MTNRPRNIANPDLTLLGTCNHANYVGCALLKKVCPEYSSYMNNDQLEAYMTKGFQHMFKYGKTWCVSLDFSSHDSN